MSDCKHRVIVCHDSGAECFDCGDSVPGCPNCAAANDRASAATVRIVQLEGARDRLRERLYQASQGMYGIKGVDRAHAWLCALDEEFSRALPGGKLP